MSRWIPFAAALLLTACLSHGGDGHVDYDGGAGSAAVPVTPDGGQLWSCDCDCLRGSYSDLMYCSNRYSQVPSRASSTSLNCNCRCEHEEVGRCTCEDAPNAGNSSGWQANCGEHLGP